MKILVALLLSLSAMLTISPALAWDWGTNCDFTRDLKREVPLDGTIMLDVVAGAGELMIKGDKDLDSVVIEARLCAESKDQLAEMDVTSQAKGRRMHIETEIAKDGIWGFGDDDGAYIDLTLRVPANARMDVRDSSGAARIKRVGSLVMVDSSGELTIEGISGDVDGTDSSGALSIEAVGGDVLVSDSSGAISVYDVKGSFAVEVDSSGSIRAEQIGGSVLVKADSSGAIEVDNVGGNFVVGRDSSGGIYHKNVVGSVRLP